MRTLAIVGLVLLGATWLVTACQSGGEPAPTATSTSVPSPTAQPAPEPTATPAGPSTYKGRTDNGGSVAFRVSVAEGYVSDIVVTAPTTCGEGQSPLPDPGKPSVQFDMSFSVAEMGQPSMSITVRSGGRVPLSGGGIDVTSAIADFSGHVAGGSASGTVHIHGQFPTSYFTSPQGEKRTIRLVCDSGDISWSASTGG